MKARLVALLGAGVFASTVILTADDRSDAIKLAMDVVSRELQVPRSKVEVLASTSAEWRDSSLGCAQRGERYQPQVIRGWEITLSADGDRAIVHVGGQRAIICSHTRSAKVSSAPVAVAVAKMTQLARADLAARLKVGERDIEVAGAKPATWPNAGLGCPGRDRVYRDEAVAGFVIELKYRKKTYRYHSDMSSQVVSCPEDGK